ncbi:MAG: hypothetical protein K5790_01625 [Nitrosopumilus sp.]|nr:hypothetical protein [Nitrosopumilus sp.]MCV0391973.1 hypothetical protein [Nitrosopumilus sp.]
MAQRITVMLDDEIVKKLRKIQADRIAKEAKSVSFSEIINEVLSKNMKK